MSHNALEKLHQILTDTGSGYEKAAKEAETAELKSLFHDIASRRANDRDVIRTLLADQGATIDSDGSLMGTVHRAVISVRSATVGLDQDALPAFVSGEDHVLKAYDDALKEQAGAADTTAVLSRQRAGVVEAVEQMKRAANRPA